MRSILITNDPCDNNHETKYPSKILQAVFHSAWLVIALAGCGGESQVGKLETLDDSRRFICLDEGNQWTYSRRDNLNNVTEQLIETVVKTEGSEVKLITLRSVVKETQFESYEILALQDSGLERHEVSGYVVDPPMQILKFPISTSGSWKTNPTVKFEFGQTDFPTTAKFSTDRVTVPSGSYDAIVVTLKNVSGTYKTWYVKDIGKVKQVMKGSVVDAELELISFQPKD